MNTTPADTQRTPVRVIVPVYRDLAATRNCLESLAASDLPTHADVLVIDDDSPDAQVSDYCRQACLDAGFELLRNDSNLGFVATVNRGMASRAEADVILLNSDTVVCGDWIRRLQDCAYSGEQIGTVTPFSNNGTICSYPVFLQSSPLPPGLTPADLDRLFQRANPGRRVEIPTAVGFCMYIKRACLQATGPFDVETFGLGYGEECDFCLRATAEGWLHFAAGDVFVFHEGGASFSDESVARKEAADKLIASMYPYYQGLILDFAIGNSLAPLREAVDLLRLEEQPGQAKEIVYENRRQDASLLQLLKQSSGFEPAFRASRAELAAANQLLEEARSHFKKTDASLQHAEELVAQLREQLREQDRQYSEALAQVEQHIEELRQAVNQEQALSAQLRQDKAALENRVRAMEQSRSWRYTAWLRRE